MFVKHSININICEKYKVSRNSFFKNRVFIDCTTFLNLTMSFTRMCNRQNCLYTIFKGADLGEIGKISENGP